MLSVDLKGSVVVWAVLQASSSRFENGGDSQIRVEGCVRLGYRFRGAGLGSLGGYGFTGWGVWCRTM